MPGFRQQLKQFLKLLFQITFIQLNQLSFIYSSLSAFSVKKSEAILIESFRCYIVDLIPAYKSTHSFLIPSFGVFIYSKDDITTFPAGSLTLNLFQALPLLLMSTFICAFKSFSATPRFPSLSPSPEGLYSPESSHLSESGTLFQGLKPRPATKTQHHLVSKLVAEK